MSEPLRSSRYDESDLGRLATLRPKPSMDDSVTEGTFRALIEASPDGTFIFSPDGVILYANPAATRILGYLPEQFLRLRDSGLVHPDDAERTQACARQVLRSPGAVASVTHRVRHLDGTWRWLESRRVNLLAEPRVAGVVATFRDVTDGKAREAEAGRRERSSAIASLTSGIAHGVRNRVFVVSANVDALTAMLGEGSSAAPLLDEVRAEAGRLSQLVDVLLRYGKPRVLTLVDEPLIEAVALARRFNEAAAREAGVIITGLAGTSQAKVRVDRAIFAEAVGNVIDNAVKHSEGGGTVELTTELLAREGSAWARLQVLDSGSGFRPEDLPHVFDPFFSRRRGGSGLGLSIAQRIVEQHAGQIRVSNRPDKGAVVTIELPCVG
jgi:PAS domain S-box-containing protein